MFEEENDGGLPFLDVLICRTDNSFETRVYRKSTGNDIYLKWNAFAPDTWKSRTLKTHVRGAHIVCSTEDFLDKELKYLQKVFYENINYQSMLLKKQ